MADKRDYYEVLGVDNWSMQTTRRYSPTCGKGQAETTSQS